MGKKTKKNRIKDEQTRLNNLYSELPQEKKMIAEGLIERAAFMRVELDELETDLQKNGWTEPFSQGGPTYDRARPQGQSYNTLNANYQKIMKQLDAMLPPPAPPKQEGDGFDDFVNSRDDE